MNYLKAIRQFIILDCISSTDENHREAGDTTLAH
jgi:hypothetical protein